MEMNKKQAEFWTILLILCIIVAVAVTIIDFSIKTAILEESLRLRGVIEAHSGRDKAGTIDNGTANDVPNDTAIPRDVLVDDAPRMEAGNADNGATEKAPNSRARRAKSDG
jgi:hypothetical protein